MIGNLFDQPDEKAACLNAAMDRIRDRYGRESVVLAGEGIGPRPWHAVRSQESPSYTTDVTELPRVRA